jgi:hypothetical protein
MHKFLAPSGKTLAAFVASLAATAFSTVSISARADDDLRFPMVRSPALATVAACVPNARAYVRIEPRGAVEEMDVVVEGLPASTDFDFFVIQQPNGPFGMAWYQGDIETGADGTGHGMFIGRFSIETFIVAPGSAAAPVVHNQPPFPDANSNPAAGDRLDAVRPQLHVRDPEGHRRCHGHQQLRPRLPRARRAAIEAKAILWMGPPAAECVLRCGVRALPCPVRRGPA